MAARTQCLSCLGRAKVRGARWLAARQVRAQTLHHGAETDLIFVLVVCPCSSPPRAHAGRRPRRAAPTLAVLPQARRRRAQVRSVRLEDSYPQTRIGIDAVISGNREGDGVLSAQRQPRGVSPTGRPPTWGGAVAVLLAWAAAGAC